MSHSKVQLWIHAVFATKYRAAQILPSVESTVYDILFEQCIKAGCFVDCINGMPDHIHMLFLLNPKRSIAETIGLIKGGASQMINKRDVLPHKFAWQVGYAAFSVSASKCSVVRRYIQNQKTHHLGANYKEELAWLEHIHSISDVNTDCSPTVLSNANLPIPQSNNAPTG